MEAIVSMHFNMANIFDAYYLSRYRPGYNFPENNAYRSQIFKQTMATVHYFKTNDNNYL